MVLVLTLSALLGLDGVVHISHNAIRGFPAGTLPGLDVQHVHGVDFLEGTALGLVDEEEHDEDGGETASSKYIAVAKVNRVGDERREERDEEVPGPVGGRRDSHAGGAVAERVHLTADGPDDGTPGRGEADDEEAGEDDHGDTGGVRGRVGVQHLVADGGPDHEADEHPCGTDHETVTAAVVLDHVQTGQSHPEVDGTEDDGGHVGVVETDTLEDTRALIN